MHICSRDVCSTFFQTAKIAGVSQAKKRDLRVHVGNICGSKMNSLCGGNGLSGDGGVLSAIVFVTLPILIGAVAWLRLRVTHRRLLVFDALRK